MVGRSYTCSLRFQGHKQQFFFRAFVASWLFLSVDWDAAASALQLLVQSTLVFLHQFARITWYGQPTGCATQWGLTSSNPQADYRRVSGIAVSYWCCESTVQPRAYAAKLRRRSEEHTLFQGEVVFRSGEAFPDWSEGLLRARGAQKGVAFNFAACNCCQQNPLVTYLILLGNTPGDSRGVQTVLWSMVYGHWLQWVVASRMAPLNHRDCWVAAS